MFKESQKKKIKILNEIFLDQAAELRMMAADKLVEEKKAKNFKDACKIIKMKEDEEALKPKNYSPCKEAEELRKYIEECKCNG
jgi:hypothetical protein